MKTNIIVIDEKMKTKLSKKDKLELLDYIFEYEKVIKYNRNKYDNENPNFIKFKDLNKILVGSMCRTNINKKKYDYDSYLLADLNKEKDKIHCYLRHIRNSIAHGNIRKEKSYYHIEDYSKTSKQTLSGKIKMGVFFPLIEVMKNAKKGN